MTRDESRSWGLLVCGWALVAVGLIAIADGLLGAAAGLQEWVLALLLVLIGFGLLRRNRVAHIASLPLLALLAAAAGYLVGRRFGGGNPTGAAVPALVALACITGFVHLLLPRTRRLLWPDRHGSRASQEPLDERR
ncbi:MAG: hypothetical protein GF330_03140 [Candidatus Eisenbacteria bacterium]|nr:hypothetical protein [Candidatus Eisenbacteria bacterium]